MSDEPHMLHPAVRALELEAISLYRAKYPEGPLWQELSDTTCHTWVEHAENVRRTPPRPLIKGQTELNRFTAGVEEYRRSGAGTDGVTPTDGGKNG